MTLERQWQGRRGPGRGAPAQRQQYSDPWDQPEGLSSEGRLQRARVKATREAQESKMIAQDARRGGNLKPEAKDGSLRYPGRQPSFQVHGGTGVSGSSQSRRNAGN